MDLNRGSYGFLLENQSFWMAKNTGSLNDGELAYDNSSRIESKRSHQWFIDGHEVELFPNKKQAVEVSNNNVFGGMLNSSDTPWGNAPSFHSFSSHITEHISDSETGRILSLDNINIQSVSSTDKIDMGRKVSEDPFGNHPSFGFLMSQTFEDPKSGLNCGGFRKVKVNQVKDSENPVSFSMGHPYTVGDNSSISMAHTHSKMNASSISMGLAYNRGEDNITSIEDTSNRVDNNFMTIGQPYTKGEDSIHLGQIYRHNNNTMSSDQTFREGTDNIISVGQTYDKENDTLLTGRLFGRGQDITISMGQTFNEADNKNLTIGQSYNKGESTIISFGAHNDEDSDSSGKFISSYKLLMSHPSIQRSEMPAEKGLVKTNVEARTSATQISVSGTENKKKDNMKMSKKAPANNFPSNVRSLLSTGMLDGVPVKYIAWSREKELRGIIKASGYLCGCQSCNFSKVINAYEFERHAGCKTKHPNNHIYFESGKTIYGIVQELRSTPQNILFEVIQTITGSPINQKSFRLWRDSFLAATRELQRIYGRDEGKELS